MEHSNGQTPEVETPTAEETPAAAPVATAASESSSVAANARKSRKTRIGKVVSNKMERTIVVAIERKVAHPLYKKYFKKTNKLLAHDQDNSCSIGDTVKIMETRPLSANKRWRLVEIIERAK